MKKTAISAMAAIFLFALASGSAFAHKVNIYAYAENGKVFADCYFVDGKKCANSKVEVLDSGGNRLLEGNTDENGAFSFAIPKVDTLKVVLHASMGHQAEYTLKKSEIEAASPGLKAGKKAAAAQKPAEASCPDPEQLRKLVSEEVDAKIKPLYKLIADQRQAQEKPRLGEIIGGIGYIVGLMGIYLYAKSRKQ